MFKYTGRDVGFIGDFNVVPDIGTRQKMETKKHEIEAIGM